jgi:hypothetical protein
MAMDQGGRFLAIVAGKSEMWIWHLVVDSESLILGHTFPILTSLRTDNTWERVHRLPAPNSRLASGESVEITSVNWKIAGEREERVLVVSYLNHGVLCVIRSLLAHRKPLSIFSQWNVSTRTYECVLNVDKVSVSYLLLVLLC